MVKTLFLVLLTTALVNNVVLSFLEFVRLSVFLKTQKQQQVWVVQLSLL